MPVVLVAAPAHPAAAALVAGVADALADALGLGPGDVIAHHLPTGAHAASAGAASGPWAVVTIHGSDRGPEAAARALAAAEGAVRGWAEILGVALGGVWVTWVPSAS